MEVAVGYHELGELFRQLGLPDDGPAIERFIKSHSPLKREIDLWDAPFWSESQRQFFKEQTLADADWVMSIDNLNTRLREPHPQIVAEPEAAKDQARP